MKWMFCTFQFGSVNSFSTGQGRRKRKEIQGFHLLLLLPPGLPSSKINTQPLQGTLHVHPGHHRHPATCFSYEVGTICPTLWMRTLTYVCLKSAQRHRDGQWEMQDSHQVQSHSRIPGICHCRHRVQLFICGLGLAWGSPNYKQATFEVAQSLLGLFSRVNYSVFLWHPSKETWHHQQLEQTLKI